MGAQHCRPRKSGFPPLTREDLTRYHDVAFIAGRTEGVAPLIVIP